MRALGRRLVDRQPHSREPGRRQLVDHHRDVGRPVVQRQLGQASRPALRSCVEDARDTARPPAIRSMSDQVNAETVRSPSALTASTARSASAQPRRRAGDSDLARSPARRRQRRRRPGTRRHAGTWSREPCRRRRSASASMPSDRMSGVAASSRTSSARQPLARADSLDQRVEHDGVCLLHSEFARCITATRPSSRQSASPAPAHRGRRGRSRPASRRCRTASTKSTSSRRSGSSFTTFSLPPWMTGRPGSPWRPPSAARQPVRPRPPAPRSRSTRTSRAERTGPCGRGRG